MGGCHCCFRNCTVSTKRVPTMHFFRFPTKDRFRLNKWQAMTTQDITVLTEAQLKNKVVCARHFRDECFMNYKKESLTKLAVPTLFRLPRNQALDFECEDDNGKPTLVTLQPTKIPHLIPPKEFVLPFILEDDKISPEMYDIHEQDDTESNNEMILEAQTDFSEQDTDTMSVLDDVILDLEKKDDKIEIKTNSNKRKVTILNQDVLITNCNKKFKPTETTVSAKNATEYEIQILDETVINDEYEKSITNSPVNQEFVTVVDYESEYDALLSKLKKLEEDQQKTNEKNRRLIKENKTLYEKKINLIKENKSLLQDKKLLSDINKNIENINNELTIKCNDSEAKYEKLNKSYALLEEDYRKIQQVQQQASNVSSTKETTTNKSQISIPSSLSKAQLFNGIKKYLSTSMLALLRMEMFGSSEREWKPDEQRASVDLLRLGEKVFTYFRDEWRFRLPPLRQVRDWLNSQVEDEDEYDL